MNTALPPTQRSHPHPHRKQDEDIVTHAALRPTILIALAGLAACSEETPTGPNTPTAVITSPASGLTLQEGVPIRLAGSATDPQDGPLGAAALAWSSSIDGSLGTGSTLDLILPSTGVHTITLAATDSDGNTGDAAVSVLVEELEFLDGTVADPQIGIVVHSLDNAVRLFQVGDPEERHDIALGASSAVTATGISIRGETAVVPLGNAASVATIDLRSRQIASAFFAGTVAWNTATGTFVRDASDPICAPLDGGGCRGAFAAHTAADGSLYQTFFGSVRLGLPPQIFRYEPDTFALADSIASAGGPVAVEIRSFRR